MTPRLLLLGGIDPSGGAGITIDAIVATLHGSHALPVAVATTVQGQSGFVRAVAIDENVFCEQVATVLADGDVHAIKVGFVGHADTLARVAELLAPLRERVPIVVDPVLSATTGGLTEPDGLAEAYREHLLPLAHLVTPNTPELMALGDGEASKLLRRGAHAVLHKGGHGDGEQAIDELCIGEQSHRFARPRLEVGPVRGTGCALASAIAARIARREDLVAACRGAGDWLAAMLARLRPRPSGRPSHLPFPRSS